MSEDKKTMNNVTMNFNQSTIGSAAGGDVHHHGKTNVSGAPRFDGDQKQQIFNKDVKLILEALVDFKEKAESDIDIVNKTLEQTLLKGGDEKSIDDMRKMIEELWLNEKSEEFKTSLQKLEGSELIRTVLESKNLGHIIKALLVV